MNSKRACILLAGCVLLPGTNARSQAVTERPLRIIVAAEEGTLADEQIRALLPALSKALKRTALLDNRGANDGIPASQAAARGEPNGDTLLFGNSLTHGANPALHARLPYDPVRDFAAVTQVSATGTVLAASPRLPVDTIEALVRHAGSAQQPLTLSGEEAVDQLAAEALARHLRIAMRSVRSASTMQTLDRLRSNEVDLALLTPYVARPHVHAGRIKALGITGSDRSSVLPELPTLAEQGIEGFDLPSWEGLFAPAGTPSARIDAVYRATRQALDSAALRSLYRDLGIRRVGSTPEMFAAKVKHDIAVFRRFAEQRTNSNR